MTSDRGSASPLDLLVDRFNARDLLGLLVLFAGLAVLAREFWAFTLDDAYINLRYAENLADGHGLTWNPGHAPSEGYTTTLWAILGAIPHLLGIEAIQTMKLASVASLALAILGLYAWGRIHEVHRGLLVGVLAALAFSPAVSILAVQGMETMTAMLLVLAASWAAYSYVRQRSRRALGVLLAANVGLLLIRPGLAVFAAGLVLGVTGTLWVKDRASAKRFFGQAVVFNLVPALVYVGLRVWYFGELFPNAVLVKGASKLVHPRSLEHLFFLSIVVLGPALVVSLAAAIGRWSNVPDEELRALVPMLFAAGLCVLALAKVRPAQGFFARFHTPVAPALLLPLLLIAGEVPVPEIRLDGSIRDRFRSVAAIGLVALLLVAPLQTLSDADLIYEQKHPADREAAGQALASFDGSTHRMFVTEAGALPYFSGWLSVDDYGLTNTTVAKHGLEPATIERFDPHLVQAKDNLPFPDYYPAIAAFLDGSSYQLAAAIEKTGASEDLHVYFVGANASDARAITCQLSTIPTVDYANRTRTIDRLDIDVEPAPWDRSDCPTA